MASKKGFKKDLNYVVFDIVEECFSIQLYNPSKTPATEELIEEVIVFRNSVTEQVHKAKTKKEFTDLTKEVQSKIDVFIDKVNALV